MCGPRTPPPRCLLPYLDVAVLVEHGKDVLVRRAGQDGLVRLAHARVVHVLHHDVGQAEVGLRGGKGKRCSRPPS